MNVNVYATPVSHASMWLELETWVPLKNPTTLRTWTAIEHGARGVLREVSLSEEWRVGRPLARAPPAPHYWVSGLRVQLQ